MSKIKQQQQQKQQKNNNNNNTPQQLFYGHLSGTTQISQYQKKYSPTHTYHDHQPYFISFLHPLRSTASSLFNLHGWQFFAPPLSRSSLIYLLVWNPPFHTPYSSSPNHCLHSYPKWKKTNKYRYLQVHCNATSTNSVRRWNWGDRNESITEYTAWL